MQDFKSSGGLAILYLQRIYFFKMPREGENVDNVASRLASCV